MERLKVLKGTEYEEYDYCPDCGQAILWEDKQ